uniref:Uncharacterized protein n=1 Tax=Anguilla anguilla TaxID=7936 RepID=A0A0E9XP41_ANGAN
MDTIREKELLSVVLCGEWKRGHSILAERWGDAVPHQQP